MGSFVKKNMTCTFAKISGTTKLNTQYLECRLKLSIFMLMCIGFYIDSLLYNYKIYIYIDIETLIQCLYSCPVNCYTDNIR
jgi:hypothetical protein